MARSRSRCRRRRRRLQQSRAGLIATLCALWSWINDLGGDIRRPPHQHGDERRRHHLRRHPRFHRRPRLPGPARRAVPLCRRHRLGTQHQPRLENAARCMGFSFVIAVSLDLVSLRLLVPVIAGAAWAMLIVWADHQIRRQYAVETGASVRAGLTTFRGRARRRLALRPRYASPRRSGSVSPSISARPMPPGSRSRPSRSCGRMIPRACSLCCSVASAR